MEQGGSIYASCVIEVYRGHIYIFVAGLEGNIEMCSLAFSYAMAEL